MKKFITFIILLFCIFPFGKYLLNEASKNNLTTNKYSSISKEDKESLSPSDNNNENKNDANTLDIIQDGNNKSESILFDVGDSEYIVAVDYNLKEVVINENLNESDKYIKVDYDEILPIVKDIEDPKNLSISDYMNLYSKVSPHIDTNMSYNELLSIASNLNINDLKSSYYNLEETKKND